MQGREWVLGASARAVGPIPKGSLQAGGGHVRCSKKIVLPWAV